MHLAVDRRRFIVLITGFSLASFIVFPSREDFSNPENNWRILRAENSGTLERLVFAFVPSRGRGENKYLNYESACSIQFERNCRVEDLRDGRRVKSIIVALSRLDKSHRSTFTRMKRLVDAHFRVHCAHQQTAAICSRLSKLSPLRRHLKCLP